MESYAGVHYHCASASVAHWISRPAKKVRLTGPAFVAAVQMSAEEIAALTPVPNARDELPIGKPQPSAEAGQPRDERVQIAPVRAPLPPPPVGTARPEPQPEPEPETPRPLPSENAATGRFSDWTSRGRAADGDADVRRAGQP